MDIRIATTLANGMEPLPETDRSIKTLISTRKDIKFQRLDVTSPILANNRNELIDYGDMNFDKILFVDGDIEFTVDNFDRLLDSGKEVITGNYKLRDGTCCAFGLDQNEDKVFCKEDGVQEALVSGAGFLLSDKEVFEFLLMRGINNYFYYPLIKGKYSGEDMGFGLNLSKVNFKMYIDYDCRVNHITNRIFKPVEST